jgi:hypothetical protein
LWLRRIGGDTLIVMETIFAEAFNQHSNSHGVMSSWSRACTTSQSSDPSAFVGHVGTGQKCSTNQRMSWTRSAQRSFIQKSAL